MRKTRTPRFDDSQDLPKIKGVVEFLLRELKSWGAFVFNEAATGSTYIKFPHWALGSIQVRTHDGLKHKTGAQRYSYKWTVRVDLPPQHSFSLYNPDELENLVRNFCWNADLKGILPGDKQSWHEFKGIPMPKRMSKAFKRAGVSV